MRETGGTFFGESGLCCQTTTTTTPDSLLLFQLQANYGLLTSECKHVQTCSLTPSDEILLNSLSERFVVVLDKTSRRKAHRKLLLLFFFFYSGICSANTIPVRGVLYWNGGMYISYFLSYICLQFLRVFLGASYKLPISKVVTPQCVVYRVISHSLRVK